jgi:hypothetical protein
MSPAPPEHGARPAPQAGPETMSQVHPTPPGHGGRQVKAVAVTRPGRGIQAAS